MLSPLVVAFVLSAGPAKPPMIRTDACQTKCFQDRAECLHRCGTMKPCAQNCADDGDACLKECKKKHRH